MGEPKRIFCEDVSRTRRKKLRAMLDGKAAYLLAGRPAAKGKPERHENELVILIDRGQERYSVSRRWEIVISRPSDSTGAVEYIQHLSLSDAAVSALAAVVKPDVPRGGRPRVLDANQRMRARAMQRDGASMRKIASVLGVSVGTIHSVLHEEEPK